jgi:hypothetical protein
LKFEYLREFKPEFENVSGNELGAHMGSIHEKNHGPKISCYCTFNQLFTSAGLPEQSRIDVILLLQMGCFCVCNITIVDEGAFSG